MSRINSRNKGSKTERKAAALFTQWTGLKFSRTPSSGGLNWRATHVAGDVVCTEEGHYFPFCIEVKNHAEINFQHLLYDVKSDILAFWKQCSDDAVAAGKIPLLMMRYNGLPKDMFFMMMEYEHWAMIYLPLFKKPVNYMVVKIPKHRYVIFNSNHLFKTKYKDIYKILIPHTNYGRKPKI